MFVRRGGVLTVGSLFSGIGGLDLGLERAGMRVLWQCESDPYCRAVALFRRCPQGHSRGLAMTLSRPWLFVEEDRSKVTDSLKALKRRICQYGAPFGQRCDCKYGPYGQGEASGCAELTMVIAGIEQMTDLQWQRFLRGWGVKLGQNGKVIGGRKLQHNEV